MEDMILACIDDHVCEPPSDFAKGHRLTIGDIMKPPADAYSVARG